MTLIRSALAAVSALLALACHAQQGLEIIPLRYRTVEQVLPTLRPLVEPGGVLSGQSNQLFIRASPGNVAEIRRALEAIDRPARRLQISVRFDDSREASRQSIEASGRVGGGGTRIDIGVQDRNRSSNERVDQRVQVLEGSQAFISMGSNRPLPQGMGIQESATGFAVVPRLAGGTVQLEIAAQRESLGRTATARGTRAESTVSARLGEWTEIGGALEQSARDDRAIASSSRAVSSGAQRIWVKVEELGN
jgi:type II secretory pathway component GspD/PulD (secretin)